MPNILTVTINEASFNSVKNMFEILRRNLPVEAGASMLEGSVTVNNKMIEGVTEVLLIDESRTRSEIEIYDPGFSTLSDYNPKVTSKGKPIKLVDFPNDSANWKKRGYPRIHVQFFKDRENHEFRHLFRTMGQIRERKLGQSYFKDGTPFPIKYLKKAKFLMSVRVQDIQAQDYFIDPITVEGADEVSRVFFEKTDKILNV